MGFLTNERIMELGSHAHYSCIISAHSPENTNHVPPEIGLNIIQKLMTQKAEKPGFET